MENINYIQVEVEVNPRDPWSDLLAEEMGNIGFESFEETPKGIRGFIQEDIFEPTLLDDLRIPEDSEGVVKLRFKWKKIDTRNWNQEWEKNFDPVEITKECCIRAPFHEDKPEYKYQVIIEPKMSFGTGHHPTTALMIQWVLETAFKDKTVVDMGCGTGVLGILSAMLGANKVLGVDNYPMAVENANQNVALNKVENKMNVIHGDASIQDQGTFDIILANITRNVLLSDLKTYTSFLPQGGLVFLSGFLTEDIHLIVEEAVRNGLKNAGLKTMHEWSALKLIKQ